MIALCGICDRRMAGSNLVDLSNPAVTGTIYLIHVIDYHWDMVERIHATTNDPEGRAALNEQLAREFA